MQGAGKMEEIIKPETGIIVPEGFADKTIGLVQAKEPIRNVFVETGAYAAHLIGSMVGVMASVLDGEKFSVWLNTACKKNDNCSAALVISKSGDANIDVWHTARRGFYIHYCQDGWGDFNYTVKVSPKKGTVLVKPYWDRRFWQSKFMEPEQFFKELEKDKVGPYLCREASNCFKDFCSLPERLTSIVEQLRSHYAARHEAIEQTFATLRGIEAKVME